MRWLLALLVLAFACKRENPVPTQDLDRLREQVAELYERARDSGEQVSGDVYEWAREDVKKVGDWEYRILRPLGQADDALEKELNELGAERWEVVWIERRPEVLRVFLKRPTRSYLRHVPLSELHRLAP